MSVQVLVKRRTIPISFSQEFEALLLAGNTDHLSLTHDLETAAQNGLQMLEDLEDVRDLKHADSLQTLIEKSKDYSQIKSEYFKNWHIDISEDLLDEVDLMLLTHKEDLLEMGMQEPTHGNVLIILAVASLTREA